MPQLVANYVTFQLRDVGMKASQDPNLKQLSTVELPAQDIRRMGGCGSKRIKLHVR
jgi:hypothetical protein